MEKLHLTNPSARKLQRALLHGLDVSASRRSSFWFARTSKEEQEGKRKVKGEVGLQDVPGSQLLVAHLWLQVELCVLCSVLKAEPWRSQRSQLSLFQVVLHGGQRVLKPRGHHQNAPVDTHSSGYNFSVALCNSSALGLGQTGPNSIFCSGPGSRRASLAWEK